jgi:RNA polymerase sigma-70 factor, ECF subfamily
MGEAGTAAARAREVNERVRSLVGAGRVHEAATEALRALGPEVLGYLSGMLRNDSDADEVFAAVGERVWRGLEGFEWRSSLRTWVYLIAHREMARYKERGKPHAQGRVRISELESVLTQVRTTMGASRRAELRSRLSQLRDELPAEDQALLVLRVDRELEWDDIALMFDEGSEAWTLPEIKREAARLRKRFQLVKERLAKRAREEGLVPD